MNRTEVVYKMTDAAKAAVREARPGQQIKLKITDTRIGWPTQVRSPEVAQPHVVIELDLEGA